MDKLENALANPASKIVTALKVKIVVMDVVSKHTHQHIVAIKQIAPLAQVVKTILINGQPAKIPPQNVPPPAIVSKAKIATKVNVSKFIPPSIVAQKQIAPVDKPVMIAKINPVFAPFKIVKQPVIALFKDNLV